MTTLTNTYEGYKVYAIHNLPVIVAGNDGYVVKRSLLVNELKRLGFKYPREHALIAAALIANEGVLKLPVWVGELTDGDMQVRILRLVGKE